MTVQYISHMGSDLSVVNAARVSFDKQSDWIEDPSNLYQTKQLKPADKKLIYYLAKHNHWSPFAHTSLSLRITAPIFVARQLVKHQVGLAWNEVSRRYVDSEPEFFMPEAWRMRHENKKQGSSETEIEYVHWEDETGGVGTETVSGFVDRFYDEAFVVYQTLLDNHVCPEQARMVLPQAVMTQWIWTGSLYAFARVCSLRCKPDAQLETRKICETIYSICESYFPTSWAALMDKDDNTST